MKSLLHALLLLSGLLPAGEKAASAGPNIVTVSFSVPKGGPADARVDIRLHSERDPSLKPIAIESVAVLDSQRVELPDADGAWAIDIASDVFWHGRQYIVPSDEEIVVHLREKAFVIGHLTSKAPLPKSVSIALTEQNAEISTEHVADCEVSGAEFLCAVPAGTFDVRLTASGFIPTTWLAVAIQPGRRTTLQEVQLNRGQAIIARATVPKGVDLTRARVHVERRSGGRFLSAQPNARGNVLLSGLAAGAYVITATHPDGLSSERVHVVVREGAETVVPEALHLRRPRSIAAHISPPLSPMARPWIVELTRERGAPGQVETVESSRATNDGEWRSRELQPDAYTLSVASENGDVWHRETIQLHAADESLAIVIETRRAHGQVRMGRNAVEALLVFTSASSLRSVSTMTDSEGSFEISLPDRTSPLWHVSVSIPEMHVKRHVRITLPDDGDSVLIDLPTGTVTGVVLDSTGAPASGAIVHLAGETEMPYTQTLSEGDGTFMIAAVPNGPYALKATAASGESEVTNVLVNDSDPPPARLVLTDSQELRGRVVSTTGPVVGARVQVVPRGVWVPTVYTYTTREDGRFGAKLPKNVNEVDLLIAPPGFAFTAANVPYAPDVLTIQVPQFGGRLELVGGADDAGAQLFHDGAVLFLNGPLSYEWPSRREGETFIAPQMEPGLYRFCANDRCAEGYLAASSTLRLVLH